MAVRPLVTGMETSEFRREFEVETAKLLRERLLWFIGVWGGLGVLINIPVIAALVVEATGGSNWLTANVLAKWTATDRVLYVALSVLWIAGYGLALSMTLRERLQQKGTLLLSIGLVVLDGLAAVIARSAGIENAPVMVTFALSHVIASLLFPWSPWQAAQPAIVVLAANAVSRLVFEPGGLTGDLWAIGFSPFAAVPGTLVCYVRHTRRVERFGYRFVQSKYGKLKDELATARQIHESVFPMPRTGETVGFTYRFEPMRQIGGDYLFASACPTPDGEDEQLSVVVLDVTGHGIPAALTVNRLHGEIELLYADDPHVAPEAVLRRLNRYVHLTLAKHSIFVTALVARACPQTGELVYANAGHPPAFLLGSDGTIDEIGPTAMMLGAVPDEAYECGSVVRLFGPRDGLVAYTDGASEARNEHGRMLRTAGVRDIVAEAAVLEPGERAARIQEAVVRHRAGRQPDDDTLIVEIFRPAKARSAVRQPPQTAEAEADEKAGSGVEMASLSG